MVGHVSMKLIPDGASIFLDLIAKKLLRTAARPPFTPEHQAFVCGLTSALAKIRSTDDEGQLTLEELKSIRIAITMAQGYGRTVPMSLDRFREELDKVHQRRGKRKAV